MIINLLKDIKNYVFIDPTGITLTPSWFGKTNVYNSKEMIKFSAENLSDDLILYIGFAKSMKLSEITINGTGPTGIYANVYYTNNDWVETMIEKTSTDEMYNNFWLSNYTLNSLPLNSENVVNEISCKCLKIVFTGYVSGDIVIDSLIMKGEHSITLSKEDYLDYIFQNYTDNMSKIFKGTNIQEIVDNYVEILNPEKENI